MSNRVTLKNIASGYLSIDDLNSNFSELSSAIDDTLSRHLYSSDNELIQELDLNHNNVINVGDPVNATDAVNLRYLSTWLSENMPIDPDNVVPGQIPHSYLAGLSADDHPQYLNVVRGDQRYYTKTSSDERYSLLGHKHQYTDIGNFDVGVSQYAVPKTGGTFNGDITVEGTFTLNGVPHTRLMHIKDGESFVNGDYVKYLDGSWVRATGTSGGGTVSELKELSDVWNNMTPNVGEYLRFGTYGTETLFSSEPLRGSDIDPNSGPIPYSAMPIAFSLDDINLNNTSGHEQVMYRQKDWTGWSAKTAGSVGQVLGVTDNAGVREVDWINTTASLDTSSIYELQDTLYVGTTAGVGQPLVLNNTAPGTAGHVINGNVGAAYITGTLSDSVFPTHLQTVVGTAPTTKSELLVSNSSLNWGVLTPGGATTTVLTSTPDGSGGYDVSWLESSSGGTSDCTSCAISDLSNVSLGDAVNNSAMIWDTSLFSGGGGWRPTYTDYRDYDHAAHRVISVDEKKLPSGVYQFGITTGTVAEGDHIHSIYQLNNSLLTSLTEIPTTSTPFGGALLLATGGQYQAIYSTSPTKTPQILTSTVDAGFAWVDYDGSGGTATDWRLPEVATVGDMLVGYEEGGAYKWKNQPITALGTEYVLKAGDSTTGLIQHTVGAIGSYVLPYPRGFQSNILGDGTSGDDGIYGFVSRIQPSLSEHGNGARFNLYNDSSFSGGNTAVYAHARAYPGCGGTIAQHGEIRDWSTATITNFKSEYKSFATSSGTSSSSVVYGVAAQMSNGANNPYTGGSGLPSEVPSSQYHFRKETNSRAMGILGSGGTDGAVGVGSWKYGLFFGSGSVQTGGSLIHTGTGSNPDSQVPDYGVYFGNTDFTTAAVSVKRDNKIVLDGSFGEDCYIKVNSANEMEFYIQGVRKMVLNSATPTV